MLYSDEVRGNPIKFHVSIEIRVTSFLLLMMKEVTEIPSLTQRCADIIEIHASLLSRHPHELLKEMVRLKVHPVESTQSLSGEVASI